MFETIVVADERYAEKRRELEKLFVPANLVEKSAKTFHSPDGAYRLFVCQFSTGENTWNVSCGIVERVADGERLAVVQRNFGHFWHAWASHPNGCEYLLCGEDYQGYSVINLTRERTTVYFPEEGHRGVGFCWTAAYPSPDGLMLAVDGCYWACPYEVVFYDFRSPDDLPLAELDRIGSLDSCEGWSDNDTFVLTRDVEFRLSDGAPYESLTDEEQEPLDDDSSLVGTRLERVEFARPAFPD